MQLYDERTGRWRVIRERDPEMTPREFYTFAGRDLLRAALIFGSVYGAATLLKYCG